MENKDFHEHTRLTMTFRDANGKLRPGNFYVLKKHGDYMIVRMADRDGILRKLKYSDVVKVVHARPVATQDHYAVPEALLLDKHWKEKTEIQHYASSPHMGK